MKIVRSLLLVATVLSLANVTLAGDSVSYEIRDKGVRLIVEVTRTATALLVINHSSSDVTIRPSDILFTTKGKQFSPCTFFRMSLFGLGSPGVAATINKGEQDGLVLGGRADVGASGCENPVAQLVVPLNISIEINHRKLQLVAAPRPDP